MQALPLSHSSPRTLTASSVSMLLPLRLGMNCQSTGSQLLHEFELQCVHQISPKENMFQQEYARLVANKELPLQYYSVACTSLLSTTGQYPASRLTSMWVSNEARQHSVLSSQSRRAYLYPRDRGQPCCSWLVTVHKVALHIVAKIKQFCAHGNAE